jgi:hypothetical protein
VLILVFFRWILAFQRSFLKAERPLKSQNPPKKTPKLTQN